MVNKKAQDFSIGTLLALLVGAVAVVLIIFAASGTFGNLGDLTGGFNKANIGSISFSCNNKCTLKDSSYCTTQEDVRFEKGGKKEKYTCQALESIPNSGVLLCENLDCNLELVTCDKLKVFCSGTDISKCNYAWIDQATLTTYKADTGPGKTYKEVTDSTTRVTDTTDKNAAVTRKTPFCVKIILN